MTTLHLTAYPDEVYEISLPSAYARGILWGQLLMEMVGKVIISCPNTGYEATLEFCAKPWIGGEYNRITGSVKRNNHTTHTINGKWDSKIEIRSSKTKKTDILWDPQGKKPYEKNVRPIEDQLPNESRRLWLEVSNALAEKDQVKATDEKTKLEEAQREGARDRADRSLEWEPKLFKFEKDRWVYRYFNSAPYDPTEGEEVEENGVLSLIKNDRHECD